MTYEAYRAAHVGDVGEYKFTIWDGENSIVNPTPLADELYHSILAFKLYFQDENSSEEEISHQADQAVFLSESRFESLPNKIAFACASSGQTHVVIPRDKIGAFIKANQSAIFVTQNASFEYHIVRAFLSAQGDSEALDVWWEITNECRLRDIFILDILIRLAIHDGSTKPRSLQEIVKEHAGIDITDPVGCHYRYGQRYFTETLATKFTSEHVKPLHEESLTEFAIRDVIVMQMAYASMHATAYNIMLNFTSEIFTNAFQTYGPLSEGIQVKGNIVLSMATMNGIAIDLSQVDEIRKKMDQRLQQAVEKLQSTPKYAGLFHLTIGPSGTIVPVRESGKPSVVKSRLEELLLQAAAEISDKYGIDVTIPYVEGGISLSTKIWSEYVQYHEFIAAWVEMEQAAHFAAFLHHLKDDRAHPEYSVLVRNGRSAAQNPPIQQTPRKGGFREIFRASEGHVLVTIDYNYIELCTLAAVCLARYHFSVLADVIKNGTDPHSFTASMIEGVDLQTFMSWANHPDPALREKFASLRQRAKAVNFGIPSGLSAAGLSMYAKTAYGVELSAEDAEQFRKRLIEDIYPELGIYLKDSDMQRLAQNLKVPENVCWEMFSFKQGERSPAVEGGIRNVVRGKGRKDGKAYSPYFARKIWNGLKHLARDPQLLELLEKSNGEGNEEVFKALFGRPVCTLTGRIRGKVGFTQACNTPFSGLAADGAKLALWNLYSLGYKIVGFIHDEVIIELPMTPTNTYTEEVKEIQDVFCRSMQELTGPIPIASSAVVSYVWSKQAVPTYNSDGELIPWIPPESQ